MALLELRGGTPRGTPTSNVGQRLKTHGGVVTVRGTGCGPLKKRRTDNFAPDADLVRQANALLGVGVRKADLPKQRKPGKLTRFDLIGAETTHKPMREY